jgi:small subunit ribosomal protein S10
MAKTTKSTSKKNTSKTSKKAKKVKKVSPKKTSTKRKSASQKKEEELQRIRIKIRAYDHRLIDESARKIIDNTIRQGVKFLGPVPLPTEKRKWTVNRSTFVHKDARDQYEMRIYKRIIDIINPGSKLIDSLSRLDLPAGVDIEIKY